MIVVDSNILAFSLIHGEKTLLARKARKLDPQWRMPTLWRHEMLNILSSYGRFKGTTPIRLQSLWKRALSLFASDERSVDLSLALRLSVQHKVSAYDAQFIALAKALRVLCVTEDGPLRHAFPKETISLEEFCKQSTGNFMVGR